MSTSASTAPASGAGDSARPSRVCTRAARVTLDTSHFQSTPQADTDGYTFVIDGLGVKGLPEPYYAG